MVFPQPACGPGLGEGQGCGSLLLVRTQEDERVELARRKAKRRGETRRGGIRKPCRKTGVGCEEEIHVVGKADGEKGGNREGVGIAPCCGK